MVFLYKWKITTAELYQKPFSKLLQDADLYLESEDNQKSLAMSASVHIHNAQTKGTRHKSILTLSP